MTIIDIFVLTFNQEKVKINLARFIINKNGGGNMADNLDVIKKIIEAKPQEQLAISAYISGLQDGMKIQQPEKK